MAFNLRKRVPVSYCGTDELASYGTDYKISDVKISGHLQRLRKRPRISYYEPENPNFDEYVYCEECADYVFEYCAIHGPLLVIPDDKVSTSEIPSKIPYAALTIPRVFLHLASSSIPGAGIGVFSTLTLPRGVRFGPYRGQRINTVNSMYCWQIQTNNNKISHVIDAANPERSNWMRYVNCARHWTEQNLIAYQYKGQLYYRTIKIIPRFTELLIFYGSEFANILGIDISKYNSPNYCKETITSKPDNPEKQVEDISNSPSTEHNTNTSEPKENLLNFNNFHIIDETTQDNDLFQNTENCKRILENTSSDIHNTHTINTFNTDLNNNDNNFCNLTAKLVQNNTEKCHKFTQTDEKYVKYVSFKKINNIDVENRQNLPFKCEKCNKYFAKKKYLRRHERLHEAPKYICNECNYGTSVMSAFKRHSYIHEKQFIYCSQCTYKTNNKHNYDRHIRHHQGVSVVKKCKICDYNTFSRSAMYTHKLKHEGIEYKCEYCSYKTHLKRNMVKHVARKHYTVL